MNIKNRNTKTRNILLRVGGIVVIFTLIIFFSEISDAIQTLLANTLSEDNELSRETVFIIQTAIVALILLAAFAVVFSFPVVSKTTGDFITSYIDIGRAKKLFFNDEICRIKNLSIFMMTIGTTLAVMIIVWFFYSGFPVYEGTIETVSSFFFLFSAMALIAASFLLHRINTEPDEKRSIRTLMLLFSAFLLVVFGEEISWGQHFFEWEASGAFKEYNFQQETNVHNFFNPILRYVYAVAAISFFTVLCLLWFFPKKHTYFARLLIPHPSLFFLALLSACVTMVPFNEMFEQLIVIFIFLYSIRILFCLGYPQRNFEREKREEYERPMTGTSNQ